MNQLSPALVMGMLGKMFAWMAGQGKILIDGTSLRMNVLQLANGQIAIDSISFEVRFENKSGRNRNVKVQNAVLYFKGNVKELLFVDHNLPPVISINANSLSNNNQYTLDFSFGKPTFIEKDYDFLRSSFKFQFEYKVGKRSHKYFIQSSDIDINYFYSIAQSPA
jgi:hypothetical protein